MSKGRSKKANRKRPVRRSGKRAAWIQPGSAAMGGTILFVFVACLLLKTESLLRLLWICLHSRPGFIVVVAGGLLAFVYVLPSMLTAQPEPAARGVRPRPRTPSKAMDQPEPEQALADPAMPAGASASSTKRRRRNTPAPPRDREQATVLSGCSEQRSSYHEKADVLPGHQGSSQLFQV